MPSPDRPRTERKTKTTPAASPNRANDAPRVSEADIALRAFCYYAERGYQGGSDVEDWLRAERELMGPLPKAPRKRASARV